MTSEVVQLPPEALDAWAQYDPPEMKLESTRLRYAFMSGWLAASADTRPEGGDATEIAAPFTSGAVPNGETPQ